jgi:hypothetical protein
MFSKNSRYNYLHNEAAAEGRIRALPEVTGTFFHSIEEIDRLDHLAYKYYGDSQKWWRICDANPGYKSPLALLGKEPVSITRFSLSYEGAESVPPWCQLIKVLSSVTGVNEVVLERLPVLEKKTETYNQQQLTINVLTYRNTLVITHNSNILKHWEIAGIISDTADFIITETNGISRVGKKIIIPSKS